MDGSKQLVRELAEDHHNSEEEYERRLKEMKRMQAEMQDDEAFDTNVMSLFSCFGANDGAGVGRALKAELGALVGVDVGGTVGTRVGSLDGGEVGVGDGGEVGTPVGSPVGTADG